MGKNGKTNPTAFYFTTPEGRALPPFATCVGAGTTMSGMLRFSEPLAFCGNYEGNIIATGLLYIAPEAKIIGNIKAETIIVGGSMEGDIEANGEVELLSTCKMRGNVRAASIRIADGCILEGKCEMLKVSSDIDIFSASPEQLLERLKDKAE